MKWAVPGIVFIINIIVHLWLKRKDPVRFAEPYHDKRLEELNRQEMTHKAAQLATEQT